MLLFLVELSELVKLHGRLNDDNEEPLTIDEIRVVKVGLVVTCDLQLEINLSGM